MLSAKFLFECVEPLLRLAQAALCVVHPLLGLATGLLGLVQSGDEPAEVRVHLSAVIATQDDGEVVLGVCALEERERGILLLGHWDILADAPGAHARA